MMALSPWIIALASTLAFGLLGWLLSLVRRDVSLVDSMWSLMMLVSAIAFASMVEIDLARTVLVMALLTAWALRLSGYITWRNWGEDEDHRYQKIRENNSPNFHLKSIYIVFGLQAVLAWIVSFPVLGAISGAGPIGALDYIGVSVWLFGFLFESVSDFQLARFKGNQDNKDKVLATGLWRFTRHPNYFGEFCVWWGIYLMALSAGAGWTIISPLLMSFLLLKVSGVAMLEKDIGERRPEYQRYIDQTNAFFPGLPTLPSADDAKENS